MLIIVPTSSSTSQLLVYICNFHVIVADTCMGFQQLDVKLFISTDPSDAHLQ